MGMRNTFVLFKSPSQSTPSYPSPLHCPLPIPLLYPVHRRDRCPPLTCQSIKEYKGTTKCHKREVSGTPSPLTVASDHLSFHALPSLVTRLSVASAGRLRPCWGAVSSRTT